MADKEIMYNQYVFNVHTEAWTSVLSELSHGKSKFQD